MHLISIKCLNKSPALAYKNLQGKLTLSGFDNLVEYKLKLLVIILLTHQRACLRIKSILNQGELRISQRQISISLIEMSS